MPKRGVNFAPEAFAGQDSDLARLVRDWRKKHAGKCRMPEDDLAFLARCARMPWFLPGPKGSIADGALRPGRATSSSRFTALFAEYPDEAGSFWPFIRHKRTVQKIKKLEFARDAVRAFRLDAVVLNRNVSQKDIEEYLAHTHGNGDWSAVVEDALAAESGVSGKKRGNKPD